MLPGATMTDDPDTTDPDTMSDVSHTAPTGTTMENVWQRGRRADGDDAPEYLADD